MDNNVTKRQFMKMVGTGKVAYYSMGNKDKQSTEISGPELNSDLFTRTETERERFDFEDYDSNDSIGNYENWDQAAGECCDINGTRLYTAIEAREKNEFGNLPTDTLEMSDYSENYLDNVGGNFIIQQSGGYGNFSSMFRFTDYPDRYNDAPYKPDNLSIRVGGNDPEPGFNELGDIILSDAEGYIFAFFLFPNRDGTGGLILNGTRIEDNRNNGLYEVKFENIDWKSGEFDVSVYRQTPTGYEPEPVFSENRMSFDDVNAQNFNSVSTHVYKAGHVYLDQIVVENVSTIKHWALRIFNDFKYVLSILFVGLLIIIFEVLRRAWRGDIEE